MNLLPLFGKPILNALARSTFITASKLQVPGILARCFEGLQQKGLDVQGLFRKSGLTSTINQLQAAFEEAQDPFKVEFMPEVTQHSIAGLMKRYIQQLPEPVIPRNIQPEFLRTFDEEAFTADELVVNIRGICEKIPTEHLHLLRYIMEISDAIHQNQDQNQMTYESLAIIFAPTSINAAGVEKHMKNFGAPVKKNKTISLKKATRYFLDRIRRKSDSGGEDILQLDLVKNNQTWIRIFGFMMNHPEIFQPANAQEEMEGVVETIGDSHSTELEENVLTEASTSEYSENKGSAFPDDDDVKPEFPIIHPAAIWEDSSTYARMNYWELQNRFHYRCDTIDTTLSLDKQESSFQLTLDRGQKMEETGSDVIGGEVAPRRQKMEDFPKDMETVEKEESRYKRALSFSHKLEICTGDLGLGGTINWMGVESPKKNKLTHSRSVGSSRTVGWSSNGHHAIVSIDTSGRVPHSIKLKASRSVCR